MEPFPCFHRQDYWRAASFRPGFPASNCSSCVTIPLCIRTCCRDSLETRLYTPVAHTASRLHAGPQSLAVWPGTFSSFSTDANRRELCIFYHPKKLIAWSSPVRVCFMRYHQLDRSRSPTMVNILLVVYVKRTYIPHTSMYDHSCAPMCSTHM